MSDAEGSARPAGREEPPGARPASARAPTRPTPSVRAVAVSRHAGSEVRGDVDSLVAEEPLEIRLVHDDDSGKRVARSISVTMRTPGDDLELAAGFLATEAIVGSASSIERLRHCGPPVYADGTTNVVEVTLAPGTRVDVARLSRNFYTTSSCGVCGKSSLAAVRTVAPPLAETVAPSVAGSLLGTLPAALRREQRLFSATGGLHAAALFTPEGELVAAREDVGRHNAVDKLVGWALLRGALPLSRDLLFLSGRAGFELVQKALVAGIPIVAAVGAPSSLSVELAESAGMTLVGFVRDGRFNVYSGEARIV